jgi:hypothetical protein
MLSNLTHPGLMQRPSSKVRLVAQIHDELLFECEEGAYVSEAGAYNRPHLFTITKLFYRPLPPEQPR